MPTWYDDSLFILHYDHPYAPSDDPTPGSGLDREQIRRLLRLVRPDAVQYHAKGQPGYVPFTTSYGNQLPALQDSPDDDPLTVWREVTWELEIRLILAYGGLIDRHAADERPDWLRITVNGLPYPNRALCPNRGYVEERMLPQLDEIMERYQPDGIWVDGESWTVSPCYCTGCTTDYQMLHGRSAPLDRWDSWWPQWLQFHRESFQRYVTRVSRYLQDRKADVAYATNAGYCTHQPEAPPPGVERLTWDLSPAFALRQAGMEARFLDSHGIPFDLMTWNQCSARPWAQGKLPALPSYPKTLDHLAQEGAAILANGGRWTIGLNAFPDDALPEGQHGVVAEAARYARDRQPWCRDTDSAAYVALVHADATHRKAGNGLYDAGPSLDRIRGAHQALLELHHPHDIINVETLLERMARYQVILLPEQIALPPDLDGPLGEWVRAGGRLIASGRVSPHIADDVPTFALEEVLGVRWTGGQEADGYFLHRGLPMRVDAPVYHVALHGADVVRPRLRSAHEVLQHDSGSPGVTYNRVGEGGAFYIAGDFFAAYHRCQYPGFRELLGDLLQQALPQPPLLTTAPPTMEITQRRRGAQTIVHFVNHAVGKTLAQNSAFIEEVPPAPPFSLSLALAEEPAEVRLQPGNSELEWSYAGGTLTAFIPSLHLHAMLVIE